MLMFFLCWSYRRVFIVKVVDFRETYILRLVCIISTLTNGTVLHSKSFIRKKSKLYEHTIRNLNNKNK